jgi:hypothetical protein
MEGIYRKFDRNGVLDNDAALQALLESGLQMVEPDATEVSHWRGIVGRSHQELAREAVFDATLLEQMRTLLDAYRKSVVVTGH